ncbi:hypothetical protein [Clostridium massiliamazoniense]|uniref:hypothetical protein n=1 Tax=Clostridium massiliamazoniense TaxID=1347366 RepID=UPI0006D78B31|nr:hypothetical protein [Clostridium massiliamazoniense]
MDNIKNLTEEMQKTLKEYIFEDEQIAYVLDINNTLQVLLVSKSNNTNYYRIIDINKTTNKYIKPGVIYIRRELVSAIVNLENN